MPQRDVLLTPPSISKATVSEYITCVRPAREGLCNISFEKKGSKNIVHCYGHGSWGWTTLFGSVQKALRLLPENVSKKSPIRILGGGCIGLSCAIELSRKGYHVAGITAKELYNTSSRKAAGYFALLSSNVLSETQAIQEMGMETFLTYQTIERGEHPYLSPETIHLMPVYCGIHTESGVEDLQKRGLLPPPETVLLDFGNGVRHPDFVKHMTYFLNTPLLMTQLETEVNKLGIPISIKESTSFEEEEESYLFNCTGLGSQILNRDSLMIPIRGHLIALNEEAGVGHRDYMICTEVMQEGKIEYLYMFPKTLCVSKAHPQGLPCNGVLGGTFIPSKELLSQEEQEKRDVHEFQRILDRNRLFFQG